MDLPPDARLLRHLAFAPAACLTESLREDLVQWVIPDPKLAPGRPKVPRVPDHSNVERVWRAQHARARGEAVKADQLIRKFVPHPDLCGHTRDHDRVRALPPAGVLFSESKSSDPPCALVCGDDPFVLRVGHRHYL